MPVIHSFSGFAQTPNLAESYLGGQRLFQQEQQSRRESADRLALGFANLSAQREQAQMEMSAKAAAMAQDNLRKAQELEIQKSYHDQLIGIQERNLQLEAARDALSAQKAALTMGAQQEYRRRVAAGEDVNKVSAELGPILYGERGGEAIQPPTNLGEIFPLEYKGQKLGFGARTGPRSMSVLNAPGSEEITTQEVTAGGQKLTAVGLPKGTRLVTNEASIKRWTTERDKFEEKNRSIRGAYSNKPEKFQELLDPASKTWINAGKRERDSIEEYKANQSKIMELDMKIRKAEGETVESVAAPTGPEPGAAPYAEPVATSTNRAGRFQIITKEEPF